MGSTISTDQRETEVVGTRENRATDVAALSLIEKAALLTGKSMWETHGFSRAGLRSLWLSDGPHGVRRQAGSSDNLGLNPSLPATCFPASVTVANSWDVELAEEVGAAIGAEAAALGVDVILGPGLNVKRSPLGGRGFEYFSEDPLLSGKLAAGYVRGVQSRGVAACPKHFAANSQELRRMASDSIIDERTLRELYLTAFEIVVREAHPRSIMSSYNLLNGVHASEHRWLLQQVLRDEWGFDGAVITDWGGSQDIVTAVSAGGTLEMPAAGYASVREIVAAVESGQLSETDLTARVAEMVALIRGAAQVKADETLSVSAVDVAAHHSLARRVAAGGAVLLKNAADLLPLAAGTKVALVGDFAAKPRYQGGGSSMVNPTRVDTLAELVTDSGLALTGYAQGFHRDGRPDATLLQEAVTAAQSADVVLLTLGLAESDESEGQDRRDLALPANQIAVLEAVAAVNPHVVVALSLGGVIETPWLEHCQALLHCFLGGQAGAGGLLDVLTGVVNPAGRLAETMPVSLADTPSAGLFPAAQRAACYREGPYVGYRYYSTASVPVAFPFGFGLSYTTFEYSDLVLTPERATLRLRNTGSRDGAEVVQLYVHAVDAGVFRPTRELKGFARIELAAGASAEVTLELGEQAFRYFDVASGEWSVAAGDYEVLIGASVADTRLSAVVNVPGTLSRVAAPVGIPNYVAGTIHEVDDTEFARLLGHPIPVESASQKLLNPNSMVGEIGSAPSVLARLAYKVLQRKLRRDEAAGRVDLNLLFILNLPFSQMAKLTGGMVDTAMVTGILRIVNGHFFFGLIAVIKAFFANRKANKHTAAQLATLSETARSDENPAQGAAVPSSAAIPKPGGKNRILTAWAGFKEKRPGLAQFLVFFIVSNGVTVLQLVLMPLLKELFAHTSLIDQPFQYWQVGHNLDSSPYFIFDYAAGALPAGGGGLAYFLAVEITLLIAQVINFFAQRNITFRSNGSVAKAALWYLIAYIVITILAAALQGWYKAPIYETFVETWGWGAKGETLADVVTMIINSAVSFWVFFPIFKIIFRSPSQAVTGR
ncbi:MAG: glycoside hydrolase family 3 C-terminal domain-containing protein [Propionibacteriaceae bacterium]|jgi:beta-glucosidase|nr:glycoside hydrolase family 3 C-terminal domain-containing protein [Propionibacteriaceae bacterium]